MLLCPVPKAYTFRKWRVHGPVRTASAPLFPIAPPWYPSGYCLDTFFTSDGGKKNMMLMWPYYLTLKEKNQKTYTLFYKNGHK